MNIDDGVSRETMAAIMQDFEINGRSLLRSPDLDSLGTDSYSHSSEEETSTGNLHRVLRALGEDESHKVMEREKLKYVIKRLGFTSFIYLADEKNID